MAIDENDAFQVFKGIETMPEEMRPRAASLLADYKTQQESAGAPLWPTQEKIKQDRRKRVQEVFDNPLVLDADNGAFVEANKVKPGIGDNLRSREASILWLADRYNADEADVRKRYDFYKADQSQKWGHQTLDDATFFNKAKADNDAEIVRTDKRKQATLTGIESALSGASMASELGRFLEAYPDSTEEEKLTFASTLAQTTGVLAPHKRLIDSAAPAMRRIQKGEAAESDMQTVEELTWTLAQSQGRDRQILMRSLLMGAKKVAEEGGKRDVSGTFAGSAINLIEGMYGSGRRGEDVARRIDPSQPLPIGEPITSVQDALKAMDAMARADIASRVPYDPNAPELPASRVLSDEEKAFVIEAKDRVKSLFKTERELKKIALSTDPMDDSIMGTMASGSASSLSLMLPLAMGPQGLIMAGGGYANMEREELLTEFPDMDPGDASRIAVLSGAVQAAGDKATLFGLDKFAPNVRKMIVGGVTKELIKKAAIQGTAVFAFENTVEAAQDLSTSVIQTMVADLKATVPQVDWQKERDEFLGTRADVAIGMVPLMLLGAGVNTAANKQQINQMLSDNDLLMRAGIIQEDRVKILELSTAGKTDEAQAWLKDSMGRRSPELAAEVAERYASKMEALRKTQDQAIALQTTSPEYTASVTRTPSGWQVTTGDGTIIPVESAEAARRIAVDLRQVGSQQEADALVNVIDGYYAAGKRVDTVFTGETVKAEDIKAGEGRVFAERRDANNVLLSTRDFNPRALETVRAEAEVAGIKSDTRKVFAHINGSNEAFPMRVADGAKGVTRILNLYRSQEESQPQVITFLHENIESSWRLGMANGTFSEQETRTAFSALLPAFEGIQTTDAQELQFIDNVRTLANGGGNDTMMRETVSEMVVRDVLGRDRDGRATGMKPGSISRAIEASVMGANTQEQVSALKSILAAIKAFTAYLKAVFSTVDAISTARDEGKLGEDWIGFVDKVLGIDEVKRDEGLAMNEAQAILEDSNMPFSISPAATVSVPTSDIDTIPEDLARAEADMKAGGKDWAAKVDLSQPVGVYRGEDGRLKLFDGHHRWLAARERGEPLQVRESVFGRAVPIGEAPVVADMPDGAQLVGPATFSITAYHGTPHKVDKFSLAKIGTGEGAQAYGWGLYFAENRRVAKEYQASVTAKQSGNAASLMWGIYGSGENFWIENGDLDKRGPFKTRAEAETALTEVMGEKGNLYTVELLPDEADFLDWDKPLSEQSEKVKSALKAFTPTMTGRQIYEDVATKNLRAHGAGSDHNKAAAGFMRQMQIPGIKYLDGNSRDGGSGTSNYVIFDESLVKILEENGQKVEGQSFSISPIRNLNELSDQVERQFAENPVEALEVKTKVIRQFTKIADKWSNERWTPQGNKIRPISEKRTVKSLDKEQAMRQARAEGEKIAANMEASQALKEAKAEAQAWRDEADAMQKEDWSPKESLVRDLITLEAIVAMFPQEIRGKIGGFVTLARKASESARLKVLQKQLERGQVLLEKHLKEQYNVSLLKMLNKAAPVGKPGEVKKSKFIVTVQDELDAISEIVGMDSDDVTESIATNEAAIISAQTPEAADVALTRLNLLELFGGILDLKRTSSQEMEVAHEYLAKLMKQGREARKIIDEARSAKVKEMVAMAKADAFKGQAGPETTQAARAKAAKESGRAMLRKFFGELSGFDAVLRDAFGPKSETARSFSERFTLNSNDFEDVQNERRTRFRDFARELYQTKLGAKINQKLIKLERIEKNSSVTYLKNREVKTHKFTEADAAKIVADPKSFGFTDKDVAAISEEIQAIQDSGGRRKVFTYDQIINDGDRVEIPLSQMDAVYISMALRQPGILEQQERHGYDQQTVDELDKYLTDEAKAWRRWMQTEYDAEYQRANEVYMRMFNARMPMIMFYAPLLKNHQGQQAILDPLNTGISSNSANPGSIKTRKGRTSSLRIESALTVFWAHFNQMEYWIANAEYLRDVQAVLLNPEVRESVVASHGEDGMATISAWIQLQMSRGVGKAALVSAGNKIFRNIKSGLTMKALALSYTTALKTLSSVFYSLGEIHMSKWPSALTSGMKHWDRLWKTNIIQRRLDIGGMPELRDLGSSAMPMSWMNQLIRYGSYPAMYADGVFTTFSAAMAYGVNYDEAIRQGASEDLAHNHAEERTALIVSRTAQPENWTQKSLFENDVGIIGSIYTLFMSDPRQKMALTGEALNYWRKGSISSEEAMRKTLAYWIIPGVMFQLANAIGRSLFKGDDDEWEVVDFATAALVGQLQGLVLLGSAAEMIFSSAIAAAAEKITGEEVKRKPFWNSSKNPLDQAAQDLIKSAENLNDTDKDVFEKTWEVIKSAGMLTTWLNPAGAVPATVERVIKDTTNLFYGAEE